MADRLSIRVDPRSDYPAGAMRYAHASDFKEDPTEFSGSGPRLVGQRPYSKSMSLDNRFAPLPSELRRRRLLADAEAQSGVVWKDGCPPEVGRKIVALLPHLTNKSWTVYKAADDHRLVGSQSGINEFSTEETLNGKGNESDRLDALAAILYSFTTLSVTDDEEVEDGWHHSYSPPRYDTSELVETVNDILLGARIEWQYVDGHFTQRGNSALYADVVKPASILLDSDQKFAKASSGFQAAITRLSENKPDVAITDAASAVQEFFRALGVEGNSVSDQLNAAQKTKIITAYDRSLLKPFTDWLNSDRSEKGNAHHHRAGDVSKSDAWLAVHVAGALMVRLSSQEPRDIIAARERRDAEIDAAAAIAEENRSAKGAELGATAQVGNDVWNTPSNYNDETPF